MKRRYHNLLFFITLGLAAVCAVLIPEVNVNSDMTKYLPDGSRMKQGLEILQDEFGEQHLPSADVRAMFRGLKEDEVEAVADSLGALPNVDGVTATRSADGEYTLYELNVPKSIDQKTFGKEISRSPGRDVTVETSQDGNTPAASVMIIAASLILLILIMMAQSWLEPVIFGISTGLAIVLNIGTNALLPSVSITTNYIVAILQMVLSLDYSIVMMNRYRQEKHAAIATVEAANAAMRKAFPSIMSSALTTLVGLLMLVFMRLKIGMDMGIVLAKGVLCSLVCTFTVLPTLLMVFHKGVMNTGKWTFVLPTDRLSRFVTRHKLPLAIFAVGLFFCAFFLSRKTDISFANVNESEIDHIFPRKNIMTLLYPTDMEKGMFAVSDSLLAEDGVEAVISYPTLMMKEYGAEEMTMQLKTLAAEMPSSETPITETTDTELPDTRTMTSRMPSTEMLTPEMMRIIYYLKFQDDPQTRISFPDLSEFIMKNCVGNPLFADVIDEPMREKLELMAAMTGLEVIDKSADRTEVSGAGTGAGAEDGGRTESSGAADDAGTVSGAASGAGTVSGAAGGAGTGTGTGRAANDGSVAGAGAVAGTGAGSVAASGRNGVAADGNIPVIGFMKKLQASQACEESQILLDITDTVRLRKKMDATEMSEYIGSTPSQTRMVYSLGKVKMLTPVEYVHFLSDDLFNRKALASFVNKEQKAGLRARMRVMDLADADARLSESEMAAIVSAVGMADVDAARVREVWTAASKTVSADTTGAPKTVSGDSTKTEYAAGDSAVASKAAAGDTAVAEVAADDTAAAQVATDDTAADKMASADTAAKAEAAKVAAAKAETAKAETAKAAAKVAAKSTAERREELFLSLMNSKKGYTAKEMTKIFRRLGEDIGQEYIELLYAYYGSHKLYDDNMRMSIESLLQFISDKLIDDKRLEGLIDEGTKAEFKSMYATARESSAKLRNDRHSLMVLITDLPIESEETYAFMDRMERVCREAFGGKCYAIGESCMYNEMKNGFGREVAIITLLTVIAIFLIVALAFRSIVVPLILVMTVMTAVYVNVFFSGILSGTMLYLAYLIVQSILMGATIDYGILFANYYKEMRKSLPVNEAVAQAYRGSIRTIMTSGLIMVAAPGAMAIMVDDATISSIVGSLAIGAFVAIALILVVLPGVLVAFDRYVTHIRPERPRTLTRRTLTRRTPTK